ncbi:hypothetical protein STEG23_008701 [Scotinomys teguina]
MQRKRNTPPLLVEMQIGTTTLESSMANSQKIGNHSSSRPSHTTLGHKSKEGPVIPQGHMLNYVHSSIICNSQNLETTKCHSTEEWIRKMWYMYTMEYYAAEKNNDFMKFAGKWMELENVILSEIVFHDKAQLSELQQNPAFVGRENNYNLKFADSFPNIDPLPTEEDDRLYQLQQLSTKAPAAL